MNLFEKLNISPNDYNKDLIDNAYKNNPSERLAWKILRDKYFFEIYKKYLSISYVMKAGFFDDDINDCDDIYNINILTTPFNKLKRVYNKKPVVLLTTGGFYPIHDGHINMMEEAKKYLENNGFSVLGGYFSPCNDVYAKTKPNFYIDKYERISKCFDRVKNSDWLSIDPWECLFLNKTVNYTDVIIRLELYLKKHIDENIDIVYVFGGDNCGFMYCFENQGIGICVNRNQKSDFDNIRKHINNNNCIFIDNYDISSNCSSRNYRTIDIEINDIKSDGYYLIRQEGISVLSKLEEKCCASLLIESYNILLNDLYKLFEKFFDNVKIVNIEDQIKDADKILKDKKTISLDSFYKGTYNISVSRLFNLDKQENFIDLIINKRQINNIESGEYILVDDDSVSGNTIKRFKEILPDDVIIKDTYFLMNSIKNKIFDVVDLRDFIIGAEHSGLKIQLPNNEIVRVPYIFPFVNLETRASLSPRYQGEFSRRIIDINIEFYKKIDENILLSEVNEEFRKLMIYYGFNSNDNLINILRYLKNIIK